jgi:hypothetical protein
VAAAAVPESVHSLPVQSAAQLHSNEPTAIDSTSPATPKSSRHPPLSKSVRDLVIESAAGARCPNPDVLRGTTGMLRFGGCSTLPMRHVHARPCGRGTSAHGSMSDRRLHSLLSPCACACVRGCSRVGVSAVRASARRDGGASGDGRFPIWALAGIGISRNRDIPIKDLGGSETESLALP